jgi:methylmalonyl-CoA mutase N-terminal domain/subunit
VKRERDGLAVEEALQRLKRGAEGSENTMPLLLDAVRAYATVGEMCAVLKEVFGAYTETNVL